MPACLTCLLPVWLLGWLSLCLVGWLFGCLLLPQGLTSVPMTLEGTVSQADQQQRWYLKAVSEKFPAIFGYSETFRLKSPPPTTTRGSAAGA